MKIYIATKWENKPYAREVRSQLEAMGHKVTSKWLDTGANDGPWPLAAKRDIADVQRAHIVCVLQDGYNLNEQGGCGMWVEMGIAIGLEMPVVIVTPTLTKRGVFHAAPGVTVVKQLTDFFTEELPL